VLVIAVGNFNMTTALLEALPSDYGPLDFVKNLTLGFNLDWWRALIFNQPIAAGKLHVLESSETATLPEDAEALEQFDYRPRLFRSHAKQIQKNGRTNLA